MNISRKIVFNHFSEVTIIRPAGPANQWEARTGSGETSGPMRELSYDSAKFAREISDPWLCWAMKQLGDVWATPDWSIPGLQLRVEHSHWSRPSRYCALIGQLSEAIKDQLKAPKVAPNRVISRLSLCLYGIRIGDFHARKGSIIGAGISNIMIPPIIDYFFRLPTYHL